MLRNVPPRYAWATLGAPELATRVANPTATMVAHASLRAARVVLLGGAGAGKTSLGCAMLHAVSQTTRGACVFAGAYWVAKARAEQPLGRGEAPVIDEAIAARCLLLDDLGLEQARSTGVEEVLYERHAAGRQTIVTSGFSGKEIAARYGDGIARRIFGGAVVIRCNAGDAQPEGRDVEWLPEPAPRAARSAEPPGVPMPDEARRALEALGVRLDAGRAIDTTPSVDRSGR